MHLVATSFRTTYTKFHCNELITKQDTEECKVGHFLSHAAVQIFQLRFFHVTSHMLHVNLQPFWMSTYGHSWQDIFAKQMHFLSLKHQHRSIEENA